MKGIRMTEYTFGFKGMVKVAMQGKDNDETYQEALQEAVRQAIKEIDQDWIDICINANEYTDYDDYNDMMREYQHQP